MTPNSFSTRAALLFQQKGTAAGPGVRPKSGLVSLIDSLPPLTEGGFSPEVQFLHTDEAKDSVIPPHLTHGYSPAAEAYPV